MMPECKILEDNAKNNCEEWKSYEETPEFAKVYMKMGKKTKKSGKKPAKKKKEEKKRE